ncbi:hypothetical protein FRC06_011300 [Ceratobasidium sp. 370]|nr:hypothetical protein FRC06_011300 [Ceratobasidium sp. 370]
MVTVKICGIPLSTCTKRVMTVCNELGASYENSTVNIRKGEHKAPEYVSSKQAFGAILDEDGTQLFESRTICRYLTVKYGKDSGLMPASSDFKAYGLFEKADWLSNTPLPVNE